MRSWQLPTPDLQTPDLQTSVLSPSPADTFVSLAPGTDEVIGTFAVHHADDVAAALARARVAAAWWAALGFAARGRHLARWRGQIARHIDDLADLVHREGGKPVADAVLEITLALDHLAWAPSHARGILGPRRVPVGMLALNQAASLEYQPYGVVGVIGPWNYPVFTPMGLPFGGVGESGFGRIHGADGLREFARPKAITVQRFALPVNLMSFGRPAAATAVVRTAMRLVHGRRR